MREIAVQYERYAQHQSMQDYMIEKIAQNLKIYEDKIKKYPYNTIKFYTRFFEREYSTYVYIDPSIWNESIMYKMEKKVRYKFAEQIYKEIINKENK